MHEDASLTEIANIVQMDKGQLSRKIKAMLEKGLLRMEADKKTSAYNASDRRGATH